MKTTTFEAVFNARANGLNFVRLLLAGTVIVWHAFPLSGHDIDWAPARQIVSELGVDGFFAISGFLIVSSWMRTPDWRRFLTARSLRIMPAFWVCLLVTAGVLAPLTTGAVSGSNAAYVVKNSALWIFQYDIAGTPAGVPYEGVWNGSLWTLAWEFLCYLGVLVLGVAGLLRSRATLPVVFLLALSGTVITSIGWVENHNAALASRFGVMFLAGAMVWQYRERLHVNGPIAVFAGTVVVASAFLPDYRILASLPVAYLALLAGALIRHPRLRLRNDISYGVYIYAFPVQQILALWGAHRLGVGAYAALTMLGTIPLALLSWHLIEKPAMSLNKRIAARASAPVPASP